MPKIIPVDNLENTINKVTELDDSVTHEQYPSAKAVYDALKDIPDSQLSPEFVQDISQCVDTTKLYVLPDGYIYKYSQAPDIKYEFHTGYLWEKDGDLKEANYSSKNTNIIPVVAGDQFKYKGCDTWNACVFWLTSDEIDNTIKYEGDKQVIKSITNSMKDANSYEVHGKNNLEVIEVTLTVPDYAKYAMFVSWGKLSENAEDVTLDVEYVCWKNTGHSFISNDYAEAIKALREEIKNSIGGVLGGKKYVTCGDSFTAVADAYPYHIAERNNMNLINLAKDSSDFTAIEGANYPFSADTKIDETHKIYKDIPTDADYITLMFGLNENTLDKDSSLIGTKEDTTNTTLWGAYNKVFEYLLTYMQYAKIGVIIADSWMNKSYADIVKEICKYWGIPYLDLNSENVPMGIDGRYWGEDISPKAIELRNNAFTAEDGKHPNAKAHEYRSTIIENFLRSL